MGLSNGKCDVCSNVLTNYIQDEKGKCYCSEKCYEQSLPKCIICKKPMRQWTETEDGKKYCSEACYEETLPRCSGCNKVMYEWTETKNGKKYCSEACYEKILPRCSVCNKVMREWTETEDGKKYCSDLCYREALPKCEVCHKPMEKWVETDDGKKYCSDDCFLEECPVCSVCGVHTESWIESESGQIYCSEKCRQTSLPTCEICGRVMEHWLESSDGHKYCSEECYSNTLPKCMHCGRPMRQWIVLGDGRTYCSDICIEENNKLMSKVNEFCTMTGLTVQETENLLVKNSWSLEQAVLGVDQYMQSLNGIVTASSVVVNGIKNAGIIDKLASNLSNYNTMRGGVNGFKGFVFEELHAAKASINGMMTDVIANNGIADFKILNPDGSYSFGQAKLGYNSSKVDWSSYKGQKIIIDKGNEKLIESARNAGMDVIESEISNEQASILAKTMQLESKITGKPNAVLTSNIYSYNQAGIISAQKGGALGAGMSLGENIVNVMSGDKKFCEASIDIAKDTVKATTSSYVIGVGTTAIANTTLGGAVISSATAAGTALASTTAGAATIAAGTAISSTATAIGGAVASTAVGTAVTAALGSTAIGASIVAAAPLVAAGAAIGGFFAIGKKIFGRK